MECRACPSARRQRRSHRCAAATVTNFGRRIEMTERAADRAAIARLAMADIQDRFVDQRIARLDRIGKFEIALARHRADRRARHSPRANKTAQRSCSDR